MLVGEVLKLAVKALNEGVINFVILPFLVDEGFEEVEELVVAHIHRFNPVFEHPGRVK